MRKMQHFGCLATVLFALSMVRGLVSGQSTVASEMMTYEGCDDSLIKPLLEGQRQLKSQLQQLSLRCSGNPNTDSGPPNTGGILVLQNNGNTANFFNRSWAQFKAGFGNESGNYWIGNDRLHQLTKDGRYKLRVDLHAAYNGRWYWAEYSRFVVGDESTLYQLSVAGYTGDAGDGMTVDGYDKSDLDFMKFTTFDRDNDKFIWDCALNIDGAGGFWYNSCGYARVAVNIWRALPIGRKLEADNTYTRLHFSRMKVAKVSEH